MDTYQRPRFCKYCRRNTIHSREQFGTGLGCLLTLLTAGLFLPVWLLIWLVQSQRPLRCELCGRTTIIGS